MANKPAKPQKVKARQPRGFGDRGPADLRAQGEMIEIIKGVYERYGFEPVETPMFEYTDALGKFLPDSDRPNEGVFSLQDDDEEWLSLRYDLTAPLARHVAENFNEIALPYRSYRAGYVFRNEKPGPGRFRQFMQFDADSVGSPGVSADAEMCMMMADVMEALGIPRGQYVIRVNNRKVLDAVLSAAAVEAGQHIGVLRALDKFDRFGRNGVRLLLTSGRQDESGDHTEGVGLTDEQADAILGMMFQIGGWRPLARIDTASPLELEAPVPDGEGLFYSNRLALGAMLEGLQNNGADTTALYELASILEICEAAGYGPQRIRVDGSVVRGLEYYTGPVYEAELLFDVTNEKGVKVQFGSVGGGGRYDGLIARFRGEAVPATGFSIGVSRLQTALKNLGRLKADERTGPVVVTVMDRDRMADYQRLAATLREGLNPRDEAGRYTGPVVPVEMFQGNPKQFGKQLQYADRRNSPCVVIQGGDEKAAGTVQVKDLVEGKRLSETIEDNATWRASRPAQMTVPEADLVSAVRAILDAQAADRVSGGKA